MTNSKIGYALVCILYIAQMHMYYLKDNFAMCIVSIIIFFIIWFIWFPNNDD